MSEDGVAALLESAVESKDNDAADAVKVKRDDAQGVKHEEQLEDKARYIRDVSSRLENMKTYIMGLPEWRASIKARQQTHVRWERIRRPTLTKVTPQSLTGTADKAAAAALIQARHWRSGLVIGGLAGGRPAGGHCARVTRTHSREH